jgi:hypothetical protein
MSKKNEIVKNVKGVNNVDFRRTWDKAEFADKAKDREDKVSRPAWPVVAFLWPRGLARTASLHLARMALCRRKKMRMRLMRPRSGSDWSVIRCTRASLWHEPTSRPATTK